MYIAAETLDDLLRAVFQEIGEKGEEVSPTKGDNRELFGAMLEITNPLCRVSRTEMKGRFYSALGEFFWYLAGSNDLEFIKYYLPRGGYEAEQDGHTVWGAYGPRMFNMHGSVNQFSSVIALLKAKAPTRRGVIQLFDANDIAMDHADIPCTCALQFMVRKTGVDLFVTMRSNDAYKGLPHDVFAFTMFQELVARELALPLGRYKHAAGSLHLYHDDDDSAQAFLDEAWQTQIAMPPMPDGDQWDAARQAAGYEELLRKGGDADVLDLPLAPYWADLVRMLKIFALTRGTPSLDNLAEVKMISKAVSSDYFRPYIHDRTKRSIS